MCPRQLFWGSVIVTRHTVSTPDRKQLDVRFGNDDGDDDTDGSRHDFRATGGWVGLFSRAECVE